MSSPTPTIYHQNDFPLPLETQALILVALFKNPQIEELDQRLFANGESSGWLDALRERILQLMRTDPELSCKEIRKILTAEVWAGWAEAPVVNKPCHLDVLSFGKFELASKCEVAEEYSRSNEACRFIDPGLLVYPQCHDHKVEKVADPKVSKDGSQRAANGEGSNCSAGLKVPNAMMAEGIEVVREALNEMTKPEGKFVDGTIR